MATQEAIEAGRRSARPRGPEEFDTIVIGGGQAGLSVGYYLKKQGRSFVILDANERIGGSWRTRTWDSLRLFTPARYDGLPGWRVPGPGWSYPTARETADYLESYAARFDLPVRLRTTVDRLTKVGDRYLVESGDRRFVADQVVVASGFYGKPSVPDFASELDPRIVQMHSSEYRNPSQLRPGGVLLVGAGNSGADIAMEVSKSHETWLSGPDKGQVPVRIEHPLRRALRARALVRRFPCPDRSGRRSAGRSGRTSSPMALLCIRVKSDDLRGAGVETVPKTAGVRTGCRCSRTAACSTSRTSSGAQASARTSAGSTCRSSTKTSSRLTKAASPPSRASTSSASTSSTRSPRRTSAACAGTRAHRHAHRFGLAGA